MRVAYHWSGNGNDPNFLEKKNQVHFPEKRDTRLPRHSSHRCRDETPTVNDDRAPPVSPKARLGSS